MSEEKTPLEAEIDLKRSFILNIFHKVCRADSSPTETLRARVALEGFQKALPALRSQIGRLELNLIFQPLLEATQPLSRKEFLQWLEASDENWLAAYRNCEADEMLSEGPIEESVNYLIMADEQFQLKRTMKKASEAFHQGGLGAAYNSMYVDSVKGAAGRVELRNLNDEPIMNQSISDLTQRIEDNELGILNIRTGMESFDHRKIYINHGDVVGILGTNGGFKSSMARTWVYNIAKQGFNQLIYPLEMGVGYEHTLHIIQHAIRERPASTLNRTDCLHGEMTKDSSAFADFKWAAEDLSRLSRSGQMTLPIFVDFEERATWPGIMRSIYQQIDLAAQNGKRIDVVTIDYLTLISKAGAKNPREFMEDVIIDLARFARHTGIAVVTPVQCNRNRIEKGSLCAATHQWTTEDIYNYSEIEKSFSLVASVYAGPVLVEEEEPTKDGGTKTVTSLEDQPDNHCYLGIAKARFAVDMEPSDCLVSPSGGFCTDVGGKWDDENIGNAEAL
jgi:replicative DNA helicase